MKLLSILMVAGSLLFGHEAFALVCQNAGNQGHIGRPTVGALTPKTNKPVSTGTTTTTSGQE